MKTLKQFFAILLAIGCIGTTDAFAVQYLKQSTAATVPLGPFVDDGDGKTAETGLTISQADIRLSKNGGSFAPSNNSAGATHMENGVYGVPLDTTDTATLGRLRVEVNESGALPVWQDFMVVPADTFRLIDGTDKLTVNAAADTGVVGFNDDGTYTKYTFSDSDASRGSALLTAIAAGHSRVEFGPGGFLLASSIGSAASNIPLIARPGTTVYTTATDVEVLDDGGSDVNYILAGDGVWRANGAALIRFTGSATTIDAHGRKFLAYGASHQTICSASVGPHRITATEMIFSEQYYALDPQPPEPSTYYELNAPYIYAGSNVVMNTDNPYSLVINAETIRGSQTVALSTCFAFNPEPTTSIVINAKSVSSPTTDRATIEGAGAGAIFNIDLIKGWVRSTGGTFNRTVIDSTGLAVPTLFVNGTSSGPVLRDCVLVTDPSETYSIAATIPGSIANVIGTLTRSKAVDADVTIRHETTGPLRATIDGRELVVDAAGLANATTVKVGPSGSATAQTAADIGLIKAKTDQLVFEDNKVNANAEAVVSEESEQRIIVGVVEGVGGSTTDFDDEALPPSRVWVAKASREDGVFEGETELSMYAETSPAPIFGCDFKDDLPTNARVVTVEDPVVISVDGETEFDEGGIVFGQTGREDSQAKVSIDGVTPGTYVIEFNVTYSSGGGQKCRCILHVKE